MSEYFLVNVGLRQGCVMYQWLFNVYLDGVVQEVNVRVLGKGLELRSANGGRFEINELVFADDTALMAGSEEKLCRLVSQFGRVCKRRKFRENVGKSKVMRCSWYGNGDRMHVILVVVIVGQTVRPISSKTLTYNCLYTLELCTA